MLNIFDGIIQIKAFRNPISILHFLGLIFFLLLLLVSVSAVTNPFSVIIAAITFLVFVLIFFPIKIETKKDFLIFLIFIVILGTLLRLGLSFYYYGNFDMQSYNLVSDLVLQDLNVYNETTRYNYSPVWFNILGPLKLFSNTYLFPFHFTIRAFLTFIDFFSLLLLLAIGRLERLSYDGLIKVSILFYLNPVSYLLTGYHGQFENLALFFTLLGLFFYLKLHNGTGYSKFISWLSYSLGFIIKHDTLILALIGTVNLFKKAKYAIILFSITILLFLLTFIFYWPTGSQGIINNVFLYGSIEGNYGITSFVKIPYLKYLFIIGLLMYPFLIKNRENIEQFLLGSIFFIAFTTGIGIQYFVLPVAFGALRPSNWFLLYTFIASIAILGNANNLGLYGFNFFSLNAIWVCTIFWFVFAHFKLSTNLFLPSES